MKLSKTKFEAWIKEGNYIAPFHLFERCYKEAWQSAWDECLKKQSERECLNCKYFESTSLEQPFLDCRMLCGKYFESKGA